MKNKLKTLLWQLYPESKSYIDGIINLNHGPAFGWLEVSTVCNLKCSHCFTGHKNGAGRKNIKSPDSFIDMNLFKLWCAQVLPHLHSVSLEGVAGEALLHPEIDYIVSEIISSGTTPCVVTNGTIFKKVTMEKIFRAGGRICISLDGIKTYNKIRKGADFNKVWKNILKLQSMRPNNGEELFINTVYMKENWFEMEDLIQLCLANGIDKIFINEQLHPMSLNNNEPDLPKEAIKYLIECMKRFKNEHKVLFNFFTLHKSSNQNNCCSSPWIHNWMSIEGDLRVCCVVGSPFWGNLLENPDIVSFMNKKELISLRKSMLEGQFPDFCKNCHVIWGINSTIFNRQ